MSNFRYDINGLRAIAVIVVVLFHFDVGFISGGFAGVDVFFVISGYLMTRIIFRELEKGTFSIFKFYVARANRIIPSLVIVCLVLLVIGWFILPPLEYKALGKHVASSVIFLSNVIYFRESGYFDTGSNSKWLLHTWSLSVEWQFYILYPIFLVFCKRFFFKTKLKLLILIGTIVGLVISIYITSVSPNSAYYLLLTRAWEMMFGALAFLYPLKKSLQRHRVIIETAGVVLIAFSFSFISKENAWPGFLALIPVFGAFLIILSNNQNSMFTNNILFQNIGTWSYSIYLWHWPVVVFGYYLAVPNWIYFGLPLSILLGWINYIYIERINFRLFYSWKELLKIKPFYMVLILAMMSTYIFVNEGFLSRLDENKLNIFEYNSNLVSNLPEEIRYLRDQCEVGYMDDKCNRFTEDSPDAIILGDSHAQAIVNSIYDSALRSGLQGNIINSSAFGCIPIRGVIHSDAERSNCSLFNRKNYNYLKNKYINTPVIIIARLNLYPFGFNENGDVKKPYIFFENESNFSESYLLTFKRNFISSMCELSANRQVYILKPVPEFSFNVPNEMLKNRMLKYGDRLINMPDSEYVMRNKYISMVLKSTIENCRNVNIIDGNDVFKEKDFYSPYKKELPLYVDSNHLNPAGSKLLSKYFDKVWKNQDKS